MTTEYTGRCLCGAVTYTAKGQPVIIAQCHCEQCRKLSGTGHSVGAMFRSEMVRIHGDLGKFRYTSANGSEVTKSFCRQCGSPMFGANTRSLDHMTITLGTMDDAAGLEVKVVVFNRDRQHWDHQGEDVSVFDAQPDWTPRD